MKNITLTFPYYNQPQMLRHQMQYIQNHEPDTRRFMEVIVVDDGSKIHPLQVSQFNLVPVRMFAVDVDVPWNLPACRNIAAHHAANDWILFTDIDHLIPNDLLVDLQMGEHDPSNVYYFGRQLYNGTLWKDHFNTVFVHRSLLHKLGGEDERLSGIYAAQETDFIDRSKQIAKWVKLEDDRIILVGSDVVADAKVDLQRKPPEGYELLRRTIAKRNAIPGWWPITLSYPYHQL